MILTSAAFGLKRRPIYAVLRGTAGDFTYGTCFAAYGAPARTVKVWTNDENFSTSISLDVQQQWYERYKVRLWFYESPTYNPDGSKWITSHLECFVQL